jgi:hypothetical protein
MNYKKFLLISVISGLMCNQYIQPEDQKTEHTNCFGSSPQWHQFVKESNIRHYLQTYKNLEQTLEKLGIIKNNIETIEIIETYPETICIKTKTGEHIDLVPSNEETYCITKILKEK